MAILPVSALSLTDPAATGAVGTSAGLTQAASAQPDGTQMFQNVLGDLISNVNQTDSVYQADIVKAAAGELDNPHQLLIDSQKANIALQLTISVRNKALESYNSIVNMQV